MRQKSILCLAILLAGMLFAVSQAGLPPTVNVELFHAHAHVSELTLTGPVELRRPVRRVFKPGQKLVMQPVSGRIQLSMNKRILLSAPSLEWKAPPSGAILQTWRMEEIRRYPGTLTVKVDSGDEGGRVVAINRVDTSQYVGLVLASETEAGWPTEALKAQAILTQTRLARRRPTDVLKDSTEEEAYLGLTHRRAKADQAARDVRGQILTWKNSPAEVYYHSTCAGHTSDSGYFTGKPSPPYLKGVKCQHCKASPFYQSTLNGFSESEFEAHYKGFPSITSRDAAGRPRQVRLPNGRTQRGYQFWLELGQFFGWYKAPGTRYRLWRKKPSKMVVIESTGAGHGVGLCQWGARGLAEQGKTAAQILQFYFPGTRIARN